MPAVPSGDVSRGQSRFVDVEVVLFTLGPTRVLLYQFLRAALPARLTPDAHALALAGLVEGQLGAVCHSTSWRCEQDTVVLTYAATPDVLSGHGQPLFQPAVICSTDPLRPGSMTLHAHHVAAHAARHLDYLATHDPTVGLASSHRPELWKALAEASHDMPVAPHPLAHALARATHPGARSG